MLIKALLAAAAASSIGCAAFAAPTSDTDQAQQATAKAEQSTTADNSVPASAVTPSANVASSTTTIDADGATVTTQLITNGPVPDTPQNRARYGQPLSHAGKATAPKGN
jgi:hypothetical protein